MRILLPVFFALVFMPLAALATDSVVVNNGTCETINEHSQCRGVVNNAGANIMVPTKTANEWSTGGSSFIDNTPTGVSLNACTGGAGTFTSGGFINGKFCEGWVFTSGGQINPVQCAAFCNATPGTTCCGHSTSGSYGNSSTNGGCGAFTTGIRDLSPIPSPSTYFKAQLLPPGSPLEGCDTTPDAYTFTDVTNQSLSSLITSNSLNIAGINAPTPVSVSGSGSPQISINGGAWGTSGTINNGESLQVRLTSSGSYGAALTVTIDVGGVTDNWSVTTGTVAYGSWSGWGGCSASCGGGTQTRTRTCNFSGGGTVSCSACGGVCSDSQSCNTQSCSGVWTQYPPLNPGDPYCNVYGAWPNPTGMTCSPVGLTCTGLIGITSYRFRCQ